MGKRQFSKFIIEQAPKYGIEARPLDERWQFFTLEKGKEKHLFFNGILSDTASASSSRLVKNKAYTYLYLKNNNYPVLQQIWTSDYMKLKKFLKKNKNVVLKPASKESGLGVHVNINNENKLKDAFKEVLKICRRPIAEKYFSAQDIRVTVVNGKVFAIKRFKPFIIGNGKNSIKELIKIKNTSRDEQKGQKHIRINDALKNFLKNQELTINYKPKNKQIVYLSGIANLSKGGDSEVFTNSLPNEFRKEALMLSKQLKLNLLGIDYLMKGKIRYIIELNATPGFRLHEYPTIGKGENITKEFFNSLFQPTETKEYIINNFTDYKKIEKEKLSIDGTFMGVGVTAFMRSFPSVFLKNYIIYCFKDSTDNQIIEKDAKVFALKKYKPNANLKYTNTNNLLMDDIIVKNIANNTGDKYLFVYKINKNIEKAINDLNIKKTIAVSATLNKMFENKDSFRRVMEKIGINPIHGLNMTFNQFKKINFEKIVSNVGLPFVIQMPDFLLGGGKGTLFIHTKEDYDEYFKKTKDGKYKGKLLSRVLITKFIVGESCSVQCCTTKFGTLNSPIVTQIMNIPEVIQIKKGSGLFVGHVFGRSYGKQAQKQANTLAKQIGDYMYKQGFKGIFGIDLMIEKGTNKVYPVEVNARYTGAYPMISMLQRDNNIIPFDIFHFLENLNIKYKTSITKLKKMYHKNVKGSHIIISNHHLKSVKAIRTMQAGLYEWRQSQNKIIFIKPTLHYSDIKKPNQFIICDGTPHKGDTIKRYTSVARISHLLFSTNIIDKKGGLKKEYKTIILQIYKYIFGAVYKINV